MEQAVELARKGFDAVAGLLDWLVLRLNDFGLPLPLWLFHSLVAVLFVAVSIWIWRWDKAKFDWPVRFICAIVPLVIPIAVVLKFAGASAAIPGVNLHVLQQHVRDEQNDIIVLPFSLSAQDEAFLRSDIHRLIVTYAQDAGVSYNHRDISLVTLPDGVFTASIPHDDSDWIRSVGTELNALSVLGIAESNQSTLVRGWFNVVPRTEGFRVLTDSVDNQSYKDPVFYADVQERWGRATVLAVAIREYQKGRTNGDETALRDARKYLIAVQRELAGSDAGLAEAITGIVADIDTVVGQ